MHIPVNEEFVVCFLIKDCASLHKNARITQPLRYYFSHTNTVRVTKCEDREGNRKLVFLESSCLFETLLWLKNQVVVLV